MKFEDFLGPAFVHNMNAKSRGRALKSLSDASASVPDKNHPVHGFLKKAASEIGGIVVNDRSQDNSGKPSDYTSPGETSSMSPRPGSATAMPGESTPSDAVTARAAATQIFRSLARDRDRSTLALRKQRAVVEVYTKAAKASGESRKQLEAVAKELDRIPLSDAGETMSEMDLRALKGEFGEEATRAAMNKSQSVAAPFQELAEGQNRGKNNFQSRHGF